MCLGLTGINRMKKLNHIQKKIEERKVLSLVSDLKATKLTFIVLQLSTKLNKLKLKIITYFFFL